MIKNYVTGAGGFIGGRLVEKLGQFTSIPHDQIALLPLKHDCDRFFFLSAYGNMAHHREADYIIRVG